MNSQRSVEETQRSVTSNKPTTRRKGAKLSMDIKSIQERMYGTISAKDMALSGFKAMALDMNTSMVSGKGPKHKEYHIDFDALHNFSNKTFMISKSKGERFIDLHIKAKKIIPAPSKYQPDVVNSFLDDKARISIYKSPRVSFLEEIRKKA